MKKKWFNLNLKSLIAVLTFVSFSLSAKECEQFDGEWFGTCSNDDLIELKIVQESCQSVVYNGMKLTLGKGHIGTSKNVSGKIIEEKKMASLSPKKNKIIIHSMVSVTKSPGLFYVDIAKKGLVKKGEDTLIYTVLGKKVQTQETKIVHADYSWSCFLRKSK